METKTPTGKESNNTKVKQDMDTQATDLVNGVDVDAEAEESKKAKPKATRQTAADKLKKANAEIEGLRKQLEDIKTTDAEPQDVQVKRQDVAEQRRLAQVKAEPSKVKANLDNKVQIDENALHLVHVRGVQKTLRKEGEAYDDDRRKVAMQSYSLEHFHALFCQGKKAEREFWNISTASELFLFCRNGKKNITTKELIDHYSDLFAANNNANRAATIGGIEKNLFALEGFGSVIDVNNIVHFPTKDDLRSHKRSNGDFTYSNDFCERWGLDTKDGGTIVIGTIPTSIIPHEKLGDRPPEESGLFEFLKSEK